MSGDLVPLPERSNKDLGRAFPAAMIAAMTFPGGGQRVGTGGCPGYEENIRPQIFKINEMS